MMRLNSTFNRLFFCFVIGNSTIFAVNFDQKNINTDSSDRIARAILGPIPTLATPGLKFLLLLPMYVSKILLLMIMSLVASSLNSVLSIIVGIRNYITGNKPPMAHDNDPNKKIMSVEYDYRLPDVQFRIAELQGVNSYQDSVAYG